GRSGLHSERREACRQGTGGRPGSSGGEGARNRHLETRPVGQVASLRARSACSRMDFRDTPEEAAFRAEVRAWLSHHLVGEFAAVGGRGGPADEEGWDVRIEWERILGEHRWIGMSWPTEYGGRALDFAQQVIFQEEYARANAPARISFFGEGLFAPTLIQFGTEEQKRRFLPKIQSVEELWCQGFSEPNAGSDLANIQTRAALDGDEWVI